MSPAPKGQITKGRQTKKGNGDQALSVTDTLKKQYLKSRSACKVTFILPREAAPEAKRVTIVGDFNDWQKESTALRKQKEGDFAITLELECGKEYRYRYLIDGVKWENDWHADRYEPNPFGGEDSIIVV